MKKFYIEGNVKGTVMAEDESSAVDELYANIRSDLTVKGYSEYLDVDTVVEQEES